MNFAYFRSSNYSLEETVKRVSDNAAALKFKILGKVDLPNELGKMILVCKSDWLGKLLEEDKNLVGFLPCSITVMKKDNGVIVGTGQPAIIKALAQSEKVATLAIAAEQVIKGIIHEAAGVGELKPTAVKLYSTTTCPYCRLEAKWLEDKKVKFNEVHVDLDEKEADDMVKKTGQMGVPVTAIQYEGGEEEFIVGFDKGKLQTILGV
jgi:glutaredoxin/uncharacterized protein (DUF302 family)